MSMLSDRQKAILSAAIEEYIRTAEPVGSSFLHEKYDFGVSPATLRSEFAALEENGYLFQPHTSAGRVPTDRGYRFFVDELVPKRLEASRRTRDVLAKLLRAADEEYMLYAGLARTLAELSGGTVFSGPREGRALFRSGIHEMLRQPELADSVFRNRFGDVVDSFEEHIAELEDVIERSGSSVFIGRENPVSSARDFSMMVSPFETPAGKGLVVIMGPKRMDYRRNLGLLDTLRDLLQ